MPGRGDPDKAKPFFEMVSPLSVLQFQGRRSTRPYLPLMSNLLMRAFLNHSKEVPPSCETALGGYDWGKGMGQDGCWVMVALPWRL